jgi:hypothetical protein
MHRAGRVDRSGGYHRSSDVRDSCSERRGDRCLGRSGHRAGPARFPFVGRCDDRDLWLLGRCDRKATRNSTHDLPSQHCTTLRPLVIKPSSWEDRFQPAVVSRPYLRHTQPFSVRSFPAVRRITRAGSASCATTARTTAIRGWIPFGRHASSRSRGPNSSANTSRRTKEWSGVAGGLSNQSCGARRRGAGCLERHRCCWRHPNRLRQGDQVLRRLEWR